MADTSEQLPPEPGTVTDTDLGIPGHTDSIPADDAEDYPTEINDEEEEEDD